MNLISAFGDKLFVIFFLSLSRSSSVINAVKQFKQDYLELVSWKKWFFSFFIEQPREYKGGRRPQIIYPDGKQQNSKIASDKARKLLEKMKKVKYDDDDLAVEVLNFRKKLVNFAGSSRSR